MYRRIMILVLLSVLCSWLLAQSEINISCSPSQIFVNSLNTGSFDPINPQNQPILTTVTITNSTQYSYYYTVGVGIKWNDIDIVSNVTFASKVTLQPGQPVVITNRDLITQGASDYFHAPNNSINITDIMDSDPVLRDALQSGSFPDGTLTFNLTVTPLPSVNSPSIQGLAASASYSVRIKNINSIFLTYPGKPCGQNPSEVSMRPVTFLWNTVNTNANEYRLVVKEFLPGNAPNPGSVETSGNVVHDEVLAQSIFSDFLPFQDQHYYAWQISTNIYNENVPKVLSRDGSQPNSVLKSEWFVFKYVADQSTTNGVGQQMMAILNTLNDPSIQALLAQGYELTGVVIFEGQVYTGQEAIDLINSLLGKDLEIHITEQ